ncbi:MAG: HAMP domain-containing sensor histidine kinase [Clostridia bacterium]
MMRKVIQRKIIIIASVIMLIVGVFSFCIFTASTIYNEQENLKNITEVYINDVLTKQNAPQVIEHLAVIKEPTVRIYDLNGNIIAKTDGETAKNADKAFVSALNKKPTFSIDYSSRINIMYYTIRVSETDFNGGRDIVLRVGKPIGINTLYYIYSTLLLLGSMVLFGIIVYFITKISVKNVVYPFEIVQNSLEAINKGEYRQTNLNSKFREVTNTIWELNDISNKISSSLNYLSYEQQKNAFLMQNMKQGLIAMSATGKILLTNNQANIIFGKYNLLGASAYDIFEDETATNNFSDSIDIDGTFTMEAKFKNKFYRVEVSKVPKNASVEFKEIAVLALFTDITEEVTNAEIKSDFFANASHELKTPLTAIKGFSELLGTPLKADVKKKCITEIQNNADKMQKLINNMLKLSKIDAKMLNLEKTELSLKEEIKIILKNLQSIILQKGIDVTQNYSSDGAIVACQTEIEEILINIIDNAIKYNKQNGKIALSLKEENDKIIFVCEDTGIGMSDEVKNNMFERFYIADKSRSSQATGLGLAIVKGLAEQNNATIEVESEVEKGTKITIIFKQK